LDPYYNYDRICRDAIFDTTRDEMMVREIISKPQLVGTFMVKTADTPGTLCWARPMSPFQQYIASSYTFGGNAVSTTGFSSLFQTMYYLTKYWRGSIKIHIQSVMSNFHYCKLLVAKDYSIRKNGLTQYPTFNSVPNLPTDTLEFSAGGQVHTIEIPFISPLEQLPCTLEWNNIMSQLGMYYIYLMQPLVTNGSVASNVYFNVYISAGDDFQFYGYSTNPAKINYNFTVNSVPIEDPVDEESMQLEAQGDTSENSDAQVFVDTGAQEAITFSPADQSQPYATTDFRPVVSTRDLFRRMYKVARYKYDNLALSTAKGLFEYDVADLLGIRQPFDFIGSSTTTISGSTLRVLQNMFYGYAGGGKFKIVVQGASGASAWYVPPNYGIFSPASGDPVWIGQEPTPNTGGAPNIASNAMYQNLRYINNGQEREFSCQSVLQEKPNFYTSGLASLIDPDEIGLTAESCCELEFEIPNMSPYRFLGDVTNHALAGNNVIRNSPTTNMGHIMLFVPQQVALAGDVETAGVYVTIYAGADDTARAGYQVFAPFVVIPASSSGVPSGFEFISTQNNPDGIPSSPARPPSAMTFYTKTT
jgi:hypothetical protein